MRKTIKSSVVVGVLFATLFIANLKVANAQSDNDFLEDPSIAASQYVLDLGVGAVFKPKYPGSDSYSVYPFPLISVGRFYVPGLGQVVDGTTVMRGFNIFPSFDFNGEREASDSADLTGTNDIDWAFELGLGVGYRYDWLRGFVALRQGFNGHEGQVIDMGLDVILNPTDRFEFRFGPRATWGSDDYVETYFGVTAAEAARSPSLSAFEASSGFTTVGLAARASYSLSDVTTLHLRGEWDRFVGDAEDSPIVLAGSKNRFSIGAGITYRFAFDVFGAR